MTQMNAQQLAAWAAMPWASEIEKQEALASVEYKDQFRGESFRTACHAKTALSMNEDELASRPDIRSAGVTIPLTAPEPTLEQSAAKLGSLGALRLHESKLGLSGRDVAADEALAFDENGRKLAADATAIDARVPSGLRWNGSQWVTK
jgi:hypothetical protein